MYLHQILHSAWTFLHGNYLDDSEGPSYGQLLIGSFITTMLPLMHVSCRVFLWNIKSSRWLSSATAQIWHPATSGFSPTKITFEREEISGHQLDSGKYDRATDGDWENCVRSPGAYFEGDWCFIVLCTMFLVSCILFNKCLYFSYYIAGYLLDRPRMYHIFFIHSSVEGHISCFLVVLKTLGFSEW